MVDPRIPGIIDEAKRLYVDTEYTARGHWQAGNAWERIHYTLGVFSAIIAALGGVVAITTSPLWGGMVGFLSAAIIGFTTVLNPKERAHAHNAAGSRANNLNGRLRHFARNQAQHLDVESAEQALLEMREEKAQLNQDGPSIPGYAYRQAKAGIATGESSYREDFERLARDWGTE